MSVIPIQGVKKDVGASEYDMTEEENLAPCKIIIAVAY